MKSLLSIDIGSTYTKGVLFTLDEKRELSFVCREETPTTVNDLTECFYKVKEALLKHVVSPNDCEVFYSSSAKGGLSVVALGVVPELTLQMAKLTAYSAGAKINKVFAYRLKPSDLKAITAIKPDIILFSGGTDGGNESIVLHNAEVLAKLARGPVIIYAGNENLSDDVKEILKDHDVVLSKNILPDLENPNPEPARELIREVFLKQITVSKGISKIVESEGKGPFPTPYSVYEYMKVLATSHHEDKSFEHFSLVDMGGATTDYYSYLTGYVPEDKVIYRGVKEPDAKRTVEGDLGMRINAVTCFEQAKDVLKERFDEETLKRFHDYVLNVNKNPELRPQNQEEESFDQELARICYFLAMRRHSGERQPIFTPHGLAYIQRGKDLRGIETLIMTGGWLSRQNSKELFSHSEFFYADLTKEGRIPLIPQVKRYLVDKDYIVPLLANLHEKYSKEIIHFTHKYLKEL